MLYDYFAAVNMLYVVLMPYCHREEPFRATWRSALELLLYKMEWENY
jgi:hypothetical protein